MSTCLACLGPDAPEPPAEPYHPACLEALFGTPSAPRISFGRADVPDVVERSIGKFSISGVQPKAQARLSEDRGALELADAGGRYIVKPDVQAYPFLPANEHLTMALARRVGLPVPPNALVRLADDSMAYIVRRFDRINGEPPRKRIQEDFCSLAGLRSGDKYESSAEKCAKLVLRFTQDTAAGMRTLFVQMLFSYLVGNGDLHLKNLSIVEEDDGSFALSPAYDLVSTWIYGDHDLALPIQGKKNKVTRRNWLTFAELHAHIPRPEATTLLDGVLAQLTHARSVVASSALTDETLRFRYLAVLDERVASLAPGRSDP
ncbi:HipA domain-containing protein [Polyangium spumosum]|uniref:HipA-like C-terminal domain-containing protein n=1 Tax=Polyangium spumosum TaxID=889282 RepID=A0A6N7PVE3_9BACT|nr:hypothetical protein [Polyangium spumosum]